MGPSGSGKSTLMHLLAGLDKPTSGTVTIAGTELSALDDGELTRLRREHIGFIFQFFNLLPMLDAEENIAAAAVDRRREARQAWVDELMAKVGLAARRSHRPSELSGGEQQRVAIARALDHAARRSCSPTSRPATSTRRPAARSSSCMRESVDAYGQTTVMVTHDPRAASIADRILFIADGLIVKELAGATAGGGAHRDGRALGVIRVALKGLAGRKLRAALTAIAIVLGVAMISGTYILTDTIKSAFGTVFTQVYKHTDVVITGKSAIGGERRQQRRTRRRARVLRIAARAGCARCRASPKRRAASQTRAAAGGARRQGDLERRRARPRLQRAPARQPALQPARARRRRLAVGARRSRDRRQHRRTASTTRSARRSA